jgi:hypothetical protein
MLPLSQRSLFPLAWLSQLLPEKAVEKVEPSPTILLDTKGRTMLLYPPASQGTPNQDQLRIGL